MSDTEKTPAKASSGGAWSDQEKIAYLLVLCDHMAEGKAEGKTNTCPVPAGRTTLSCRKLVLRMKEKYKEDMDKIKGGQPLAPAAGAGADDGEKPKATPRKRKTKAEAAGDVNSDADGSPKKKTPGRKKKADLLKQEVKNEDSMGFFDY